MAGGGRGLLTRAGTFDREELDRFDEFTRRLSLGERSRNLTTGLIRDAADKNASTQQALRAAASEEELALGELLLSLVPGLGTVMNGTKAIEAFREALELERAGKLDQAMKKRREAALDAVAALGPLALIAKADKIAKAFRFLVSRAKRNRGLAKLEEERNVAGAAEVVTAAAQVQRLLGNDRAKQPGGKDISQPGGGLKNPSSNEADNQRKLFASEAAHGRYKEIVATGTSLGFPSPDSFRQLGKVMNGELKSVGIDDAALVIRGSAVTGSKFDKSLQKYVDVPFDAGPRKSDFDFAIVSEKLFDLARKRGIGLQGKRTRTDPLGLEQLEELELQSFDTRVRQSLNKNIETSGRKRSFMIYRDPEALKRRGPYTKGR